MLSKKRNRDRMRINRATYVQPKPLTPVQPKQESRLHNRTKVTVQPNQAQEYIVIGGTRFKCNPD